MIRATLKGLAAHKLRFVLTGIAVSLGVAFMAGTMIFSDTLRHGFDSLFETGAAEADVVVRSAESFDSQWGEQREPVDLAVLDKIRTIDGVAAADANIEGYAQLVGKDGKAVTTPGNNPPTLGMNWIEDRRLNAWHVQAGGRAPEADDEIVIDLRSAKRAGFEVGDRITVLTKEPPKTYRLVGIAKWGEVETPMGATVTVFTRHEAERVLGTAGTALDVRVVGDDGVSQAALRNTIIKALVTTRYEVVTAETALAEAKDQTAEALGFIDTFLLVFALIALFVGSFIIFNTFSITVAQRRREIALVRAIGGSRGQVLAGIVVEAAVVAVVASAVGLAVGLALAMGLRELLAGFGLELPSVKLQVGPGSLVPAFVAGMVVTLVAAVFPARKAANVPPMAALRDVAVGSAGNLVQRGAVGGAVFSVGAALLAFGLFVDSASLLFVGLGAAVLFLGIAVLGPVFARPVTKVVGAPLELRGMTGHLAHENAMRNPKRTSATASALLIGVALVSVITILAASTKASVNEAVDEGMRADLLLSAPGNFGGGGFSPELAQRVAALPEVADASGVKIGEAKIFDAGRTLLGVSPRAFAKMWDLGAVEGDLSTISDSGIAVSRDFADDHQLGIGSVVPATFARTGEDLFRVEAIYDEPGQVGDLLINNHSFGRNYVQPLDNQVWVKLADGVSLADGKAAVATESAAYPNADLQDREEFKSALGEQVDAMLNLLYALLGLAIVIALIGIANTLALSIHERTRELGLLRAVGVTRPQLRSVVRWEAFVIALVGSATGLAVGGGLGYALVKAMESDGMTAFSLPVTSLLVLTFGAAAAGVLAAIQPSRKAAKLDVLRAIATE